MSVRENERRDASWRDCRCSIINRYCCSQEWHVVADSVVYFLLFLTELVPPEQVGG